MSRRFRSGSRRLARRLDGRAFRPPDYLAQACSLLARCGRLRRQAARRDPHLFGPHARRYYQDTVRMGQQQRETAAALDRVYGATPAGQPPDLRQVWYERYHAEPGRGEAFRKWFQIQYGG